VDHVSQPLDLRADGEENPEAVTFDTTQRDMGERVIV
jgi:hypothetical protein